MTRRRILITGVSGLVGGRLAEVLGEEHEVVGLGRRPGNGVSAVWDFLDALPMESLPDRVDVVIHAGAAVGHQPGFSEEDYHACNVHPCRVLAEFAGKAEVSHFVFFSTGGVYARGLDPIGEDAPLAPEDAYSRSKVQAEELLTRSLEGVCLTLVRPFFPYGPGRRNRLIPNLARRVMEGERIRLNNRQGSPRINPIFVDDVAEAIKGIVEKQIAGAINLGGPEAVSIRELAEKIGGKMGRSPVFEVGAAPSWNLLGDISLLRSFLPDLRFTSLEWGLDRVLESLGSTSASACAC